MYLQDIFGPGTDRQSPRHKLRCYGMCASSASSTKLVLSPNFGRFSKCSITLVIIIRSELFPLKDSPREASASVQTCATFLQVSLEVSLGHRLLVGSESRCARNSYLIMGNMSCCEVVLSAALLSDVDQSSRRLRFCQRLDMSP